MVIVLLLKKMLLSFKCHCSYSLSLIALKETFACWCQNKPCSENDIIHVVALLAASVGEGLVTPRPAPTLRHCNR